MNDPTEVLNAAKAQAEADEHPAARLLRDAGPTVSAAVVAQAFGVSKAHILNLIRRGEFCLPVIKLGNRVRVPTSELRKSLGLDPESGDKPAA